MNVVMKELPCILTPLLILAGCGLFGTEEEEASARISVEGVDGIRFGDTLAEVRRKLGPPDYVGYIDGNSRPWFHNYYDSGPHAGLMIAFSIGFGEPDSLIPADLFALYPPFQGKTAEGIGIGSTTEELRHAWGEPEVLRAPNDTTMYYCMGTRDVEINIALTHEKSYFAEGVASSIIVQPFGQLAPTVGELHEAPYESEGT